jgi:uncharacterized protein (TIGR02145 family)
MKIRHFSLAASLVFAITLTISCEDKEKGKPSAEAPSAPAPKEGTFTDSRDGKKYKSVKIGEQVWMAENLNFAAEGSKCYENKPENCEQYGRLYNWETAMKACPSGWHLPNKDEYEVLDNTVDGGRGGGLKSSGYWENDGGGWDEFGFSALPGGGGNSAGSFYSVVENGFWWSASEFEDNSSHAYYRLMGYDIGNAAIWYDSDKSYLYSVRCLQD